MSFGSLGFLRPIAVLLVFDLSLTIRHVVARHDLDCRGAGACADHRAEYGLPWWLGADRAQICDSPRLDGLARNRTAALAVRPACLLHPVDNLPLSSPSEMTYVFAHGMPRHFRYSSSNAYTDEKAAEEG